MFSRLIACQWAEWHEGSWQDFPVVFHSMLAGRKRRLEGYSFRILHDKLMELNIRKEHS